MKKLVLICAVTTLAACQSGGSEAPILKKLSPKGTVTSAGIDTSKPSTPMRPAGPAFDLVGEGTVTDFASCVQSGIVIAASDPVQCVHGGVTYTQAKPAP